MAGDRGIDKTADLADDDWDAHATEVQEFVRRKCDELGTHQATRLFAAELSSQLSMTRAFEAKGVSETTRRAQDTATLLQALVEDELGVE